MLVLSLAEENYLKTIFHLAQQAEAAVSTRAIAKEMATKDSSVTDMLKKLSKNELIHYVPYHGVTMTETGTRTALNIIRRHRLWEVFLVDKLGFKWDEVHELAEQLEHIQSPKLMDRLDEFLGHPMVDPHGDPIPDADGHMVVKPHIVLADAPLSRYYRIVRVKDDSPEFLQYLDASSLQIGCNLVVKERIEFDQSLTLQIQNEKEIHISQKVANNILVAEA